MNNQLLQSIAKHISQNEGAPSHPYLDNTGLITAGVGQNVDNWNAFKQVGFVNRDTGQPACDTDKRTGFDALTAVKPTMTGKNADAFKDTTNLDYPKAAQDQFLTGRIQADEPKVRAALGTDADGNSVYDKLTDGQKAVMHDIQFSTKGGLSGYPNLTQAAKDGTLSENYREVDGTSGGGRNWDRLARNRAAIQGIPLEQAQQGVAQDHQGDPNLPNEYRRLLPAAGKTSDSSDQPDTKTASGDQPTAQQPQQSASSQPGSGDQTQAQQPPQQTAAASSTDDTEASAYPPVDDQTAQRLASLPDLPPAGTPLSQAFADISNDNTPVPFAAMSQALTDMGGEPPPPSLLGGDGATGAFA